VRPAAAEKAICPESEREREGQTERQRRRFFNFAGIAFTAADKDNNVHLVLLVPLFPLRPLLSQLPTKTLIFYAIHNNLISVDYLNYRYKLGKKN
jgi:hypothetical protein